MNKKINLEIELITKGRTQPEIKIQQDSYRYITINEEEAFLLRDWLDEMPTCVSMKAGAEKLKEALISIGSED